MRFPNISGIQDSSKHIGNNSWLFMLLSDQGALRICISEARDLWEQLTEAG